MAREIRPSASALMGRRVGPGADLAFDFPRGGAAARLPGDDDEADRSARMPVARAPKAAAVPVRTDRERTLVVQQLFEMLTRAPEQFDFFQVMRRLESVTCSDSSKPRFGAAARPVDEPIRLGQAPSMSFALRTLDSVDPARGTVPPRLYQNFFGVLGPNGAMPLHLTEYVRDRLRNAADSTMARFLDVFHHRMLMFFYRAWASAEPTASHDRPESNRFLAYVGTLEGLGLPALRDRDEFPHEAKLFYAGRFAAQAHNAEGLGAIIRDFFQMPTKIEQFVGDWLELPPEHRWYLGKPGPIGLLGVSATLGKHVWSRQHKFRVTLGPLNRAQFRRMLPGGQSLDRLRALVRNYVGEELRWDLRLFLAEVEEHPFQLGKSAMGWTSWLGHPGEGRSRREDLILDPQMETYRAA